MNRKRCQVQRRGGPPCDGVARWLSSTGGYRCDDHKTDSCMSLTTNDDPPIGSLREVAESIVVGWAIHPHESFRPDWLASLMPALRKALDKERSRIAVNAESDAPPTA